MARSDRLFDLIGLIRDGRLHRARDLADRLEVSLRTLYRDMATLQASGVPIEGERGVGYALRAPIAMMPVTLSPDEAVALGLALSMLRAAADPALRASADSLGRKVAQAQGVAGIAAVPVHLPPSAPAQAGAAVLPVISRAIAQGRRLRIRYATPGRAPEDRVIWPLQLEFWGQVWTCGAWCELRDDFRVFRLDRIGGAEVLDRRPDVPGRDLAAYLAAVMARHAAEVTGSAPLPRSSRR
ncbi:MAG TPA: YafY family protein [Paracoccaceae bacterium]|nr:YafY family protein [Paracoccaceae bacterium]